MIPLMVPPQEFRSRLVDVPATTDLTKLFAIPRGNLSEKAVPSILGHNRRRCDSDMDTFSLVVSFKVRVLMREGAKEALTIRNDAPDLGGLLDDPSSRPPLELVQKPIAGVTVHFLVVQDLDPNVLGNPMNVFCQLTTLPAGFCSGTEVLGVRYASAGEGCSTLGPQDHSSNNQRSQNRAAASLINTQDHATMLAYSSSQKQPAFAVEPEAWLRRGKPRTSTCGITHLGSVKFYGQWV